jgi:hypothetical protein
MRGFKVIIEGVTEYIQFDVIEQRQVDRIDVLGIEEPACNTLDVPLALSHSHVTNIAVTRNRRRYITA